MGGNPFISDKNWPLYNGRPLLFLCKLSLDQINKINNSLKLKGNLFFFILLEDIGNRYPTKKGEFKVLYFEDNVLENDKNNYFKIKEHSISFFEHYTFPSFQECIIEKNNISDEDIEIIEEIESEIYLPIDENLDISHQILGHPKAVQGSVRFWWSKQYFGFEEDTKLSEIDFKRVRQEENNFILLLQLNFDDAKIEVDYFGNSVAYFGIHKHDLENKNFENVKLIIQNT
ncbi:DUF1963 domain-containing protein [Flavobacterium sp. HNIBRBA15423]|uniref:DUF1963 domain-containing protein n=1 Tax=Flavobacterium sp. HNIBRBA15423 TaxID=3458683 RepID=UPI0040441F97